MVRGAWLGEVALNAQVPVPWLKGAEFEARTPVSGVEPWLK